MGKASRTKKELKNAVLAAGQKMIGNAALNEVFQSIGLDDLDAAIASIELYEQSTGDSIFDVKLEFAQTDGSVATFSVILFANRQNAGKCMFHLVNLAALRNHPAGGEWMRFALQAIEELPSQHPCYECLVKVMETCMEPANSDEAMATLSRVEAGSFAPRMADLARRVAHRYLAEREHDALEKCIASVDAPVASPRTRI